MTITNKEKIVRMSGLICKFTMYYISASGTFQQTGCPKQQHLCQVAYGAHEWKLLNLTSFHLLAVLTNNVEVLLIINLGVILTTNRSTLCSSVYLLNGLTLNDFRESIQQQMGTEPNRKSCYLVRNDRSARADRCHQVPLHLVADPARKTAMSVCRQFLCKLRQVWVTFMGNYKKSTKDWIFKFYASICIVSNGK